MPSLPHQPSRRTFLAAAATAAGLTATGLIVGQARERRPTVALAATSPRSTPLGLRVGPSVQVSRDAFAKHYEASVTVNPRNPDNLLGCCTVLTGSGLAGSQQLIAAYSSFNAGVTWASNGPMPGSAGLYLVNAATGFDSEGRGYVAAVASSAPNTQDKGVLVWRTDDGGRTFRPPSAAFSGLADHPWLATSVAGQKAGPLHLVWYGTDGVCYTRSTDGGRSFETARTLVPQPVVGWPMAAAGPDGTVHVAYAGQDRRSQGQPGLPLLVISSRDNGRTFGTPVQVVVQSPMPNPPDGPAMGKSNPVIAVSPRDGTVYLASLRYRAGASHTDIMISASRDQGRTWETAVPVTPADQVMYFLPKLAADAAGRLGMFCYGLGPGGMDAFLIAGQPGGADFSAPARLTARPFSPAVGVDIDGTYLWGDYQGVAASGSTFHPFWADGQNGQMQIRTTAVRT
jgi:hypothetical protein